MRVVKDATKEREGKRHTDIKGVKRERNGQRRKRKRFREGEGYL